MASETEIRDFFKSNFAAIDQKVEKATSLVERFELGASRIALANVMQTCLSDRVEVARSHLFQAMVNYEARNYSQVIKHLSTVRQESVDQLPRNITLIEIDCLLKQNQLDMAQRKIVILRQIDASQEILSYELDLILLQNDTKKLETSLTRLEQTISQKYGSNSAERGLFLLRKGRAFGHFRVYDPAVLAINEGINLLMELQYKELLQLGEAYLTMAEYASKSMNPTKEYSALTCAQSLFRQLNGQSKLLIEVGHRLADYLKNKKPMEAITELMTVLEMEKAHFGESAICVGKTNRKLARLCAAQGLHSESRLYEQEANRIAFVQKASTEEDVAVRSKHSS